MEPRVLLIAFLILCWVRTVEGQSFQKEYFITNSDLVIPYGVTQRPDGNFLVFYLVRESTLRMHLSCISPVGDVLWSIQLNAHFNGDNASEGIKKTPILATPDNGCVLLVSKSLISTGQGWVMVKVSPSGVVVWSKQIAGVGSVDDLLVSTPGRNYVLARYWTFDSRPYMACLNNNGDVLWEKDIQSNLGNVVATSARALPDQSILLTLAESSFLEQRGHIARLNSDGTFVPLLTLPNLSLMSVDQHPDGRLFFLARTLDSISLKNHLLLGSAENGQLQWLKALNIPQDFYFSGYVKLNAAQDSLTTSFRGTFFEGQRYWVRFDLNGNPGAAHYIPAPEIPGSEVISTLDNGFAWTSVGPPTSNLKSFVLSKTDDRALLGSCPAGTLCGMSVRDTFFPTLPPLTWATQDVSRISPAMPGQGLRTVTDDDYCLPLPVPDAAITAEDSTGCGETPFVFKRVPATTGVSTWSFPGADPNSFLGPEPPPVVFSNTGTFQVRHILDQAGCMDTATLNVQVSVYPELSLPGDTVLCQGEPVFIEVESSPDLIFNWNDGTTNASRSIDSVGRYILTASNAAGCSVSDSISINPLGLPALLSQSDTFFCIHDVVTLQLGVSPGWQYNWADGFTGPERRFSEAGVFYLSAESPEGCMLTDSIVITEKSLPGVVISAALPYECGARLLEIAGNETHTFLWNTGATSASISAEQSGVYSVTVSDGFCNNADTIQVEISPCPECFVYIPGVFKPASGNANGMFQIQSGCAISDFLLQIYDRWGNLVFESREPDATWDGTFRGRQISPGVYIYRVEMDLFSGDTNFPFFKTGDVIVVR